MQWEPWRAFEQGSGLINPLLYDNGDDVSDIYEDGADNGEPSALPLYQKLCQIPDTHHGT